MDQFISALQKNFLFQASLGSKELFHSNILGWILEQVDAKGEPNALSRFMNRFTDFEIDNARDVEFKVHRERRKIDLTIEWHQGDNSFYVYIENKIKSLPGISQLERYKKHTQSKKQDQSGNSRARLILTPLAIHDSLKTQFKEIGWINITYAGDGIVGFLGSLEESDFENKDVPLVVNTYKAFLENLIGLMGEFQLGTSHLDEFSASLYDYYSSKIMDKVKELRIHDLILKLAHQNIAEIIQRELSNRGRSLVNYHRELKKPGDICISQGFTRITGITDAKFCIKEGFHLGLQLQGNTLKYVSEVFDKKLTDRNIAFSRNLVKSRLWFHDDNNGTKRLLTGRGHNKERLRINNSTTFNSYGKLFPTFLYLNKNIGEEMPLTNGELARILVEEVDRVINNIEKFQDQIP